MSAAFDNHRSLSRSLLTFFFLQNLSFSSSEEEGGDTAMEAQPALLAKAMSDAGKESMQVCVCSLCVSNVFLMCS